MVYEAQIAQIFLLIGLAFGATMQYILTSILMNFSNLKEEKKEPRLLARESPEFVKDYINFKAQMQSKQIM